MLVGMWLTSLLAQIDNSFFALGATVVSIVSTMVGLMWLQLWKGQTDLMAEKDRSITKLEKRLSESQARNEELEGALLKRIEEHANE